MVEHRYINTWRRLQIGLQSAKLYKLPEKRVAIMTPQLNISAGGFEKIVSDKYDAAVQQAKKPRQKYTYSFTDSSTLFLLASNIITIILAVVQHWSLITILWIYWCQSVIIGVFNFVKILGLKDFSTENVKINERPVSPTTGTKLFMAFFFAFHYGLFHLAYMIFLLTFSLAQSISYGVLTGIGSIVLAAGIFFVTHLFSYFYNRKRDTKKQNIGSVMAFPYLRIIPMHLTIIIGSLLGPAALPFFLVLKTIADLAMHVIEHRREVVQ